MTNDQASISAPVRISRRPRLSGRIEPQLFAGPMAALGSCKEFALRVVPVRIGLQQPLRRPSDADLVTGDSSAGPFPVVLHHGVCGFGDFQIGPMGLAYFQGIDRALLARGFTTLSTRVHPTAGIATRADQLKNQILSNLDRHGMRGQRVLIVAHSMGGLDARYMISRLGMAERVAALLTVTTPHRGSPYADWIVRHVGQRLRGFRLMKMLKIDVQAAHDLTTAGCLRFNEEVPDSPAVKYFSISAARPRRLVPPFAMHSHKIVYDVEGDNDALVSVASSTWGAHLGVWAADHWHTINKRFVLELKNPTGNIAPYYVRAVEQVQRQLAADTSI